MTRESIDWGAICRKVISEGELIRRLFGQSTRRFHELEDQMSLERAAGITDGSMSPIRKRHFIKRWLLRELGARTREEAEIEYRAMQVAPWSESQNYRETIRRLAIVRTYRTVYPRPAIAFPTARPRVSEEIRPARKDDDLPAPIEKRMNPLPPGFVNLGGVIVSCEEPGPEDRRADGWDTRF